MLQSGQAAEAGDRTGTIAGRVSDVRQQAQGVVQGYYCQPVRDDMTQALRGHEHRWGTVVVWEVLPRVLPQALTVICSRSGKGRSSTSEMVVIRSDSQGRIFNRFDLAWSVVHGHSPSTNLENEFTRSRATRP
ncbi:hypothetical protein TIFTF001_017598 [Ficus carica]|uniref:Uncharacterized protein n=1 Tax=Ficus carica TaxID=3494 RepID=A0AA88AQZ7_FICCA|nr:hypothetical protein TIFTF001_017598 [Ficus carica]